MNSDFKVIRVVKMLPIINGENIKFEDSDGNILYLDPNGTEKVTDIDYNDYDQVIAWVREVTDDKIYIRFTIGVELFEDHMDVLNTYNKYFTTYNYVDEYLLLRSFSKYDADFNNIESCSSMHILGDRVAYINSKYVGIKHNLKRNEK